MSDKKNDINYNAEDIRQYLSGKLSPLQMNALEKAALDDPFLAEAIEGYEAVPAEEWGDALASVKDQFAAQQNNTAKVIVMKPRRNNWWKVAAAVLLLGFAATIAYRLANKKEQLQIAKTETTVDPAVPKTVVPETAKADIAIDLQRNETYTAETKTPLQPVTKKVAVAAEVDTGFVYRPPASAKTSGAGSEKSYYEETIEKKQAETQASPPVVSNNPAANSNAAEANNYKAFNKINANANTQQELFDKTPAGVFKIEALKDQQQALNKTFFAQVVSPDNTPLPFANVSIKNEGFGTYADVKGNFRLVSSDSVLNVEVKSVGYQPKVYTIKSNLPQNKITLVEDDIAAKQQTVVNSTNIGYAKNKMSRKATLIKDSIVNVEPADGWDNYNTYVNNNIELPDDILKNNIHGQVEISFDVKSNGTITNIKVDKSLCDNCDEVAKRLIQQGPQWKVKKGKKGKGKVTVQF